MEIRNRSKKRNQGEGEKKVQGVGRGLRES